MIFKLINSMVLVAVLLVFFGCGSSSSNKNDDANAKFDQVNLSALSQESWALHDQSTTVEFSKKDIESKIPLSSLVGDFKYIPLTNKPNQFIGDIDKVLFTNSVIFVMDQYITNSLYCFDKYSGNEIFHLKSSGDGPGEFRDIYDFDLDRENQIIYLFDGKLSKMLVYDFNGNLIEESRVPIRAGNFRRFVSGEFIFYSQDLPNDHLGNISSCNYFLLDASLEIKSCFTTNEELKGYSNYFARDYFSSNGERVLLFPRFEDYLIELNPDELTLSKMLKLRVEDAVNEDDLKGSGDDFLERRGEDFKFFSHGANFITNDWVGLEYKRIRRKSFYFFNHLESDYKVFGNSFDFDVAGMPFFSFPISSFQDEALSVIKLHQVRNLGAENFLQEMDKVGMKTSELELFLAQVEDFDQPAVLIFNLK